MPIRCYQRAFPCFLLLGILCAKSVAQPAAPKTLLPEFTSPELVAAEPEIVTPIGLAFDRTGALLVIESHTHFPPEDYPGPSHDRIRRFEDTTGDGKFDRVSNYLTCLLYTSDAADD